VTKGGDRLSTLDLFQQEWVLLGEDERWAAAAASAGYLLGINLVWVGIGDDVLPCDLEEFRKAFGLGTGGASLIRPDGYIAWRSIDTVTDRVHAIADALSSVLFASAAQQTTGPSRSQRSL
jgi:hypothetical protein